MVLQDINLQRGFHLQQASVTTFIYSLFFIQLFFTGGLSFTRYIPICAGMNETLSCDSGFIQIYSVEDGPSNNQSNGCENENRETNQSSCYDLVIAESSIRNRCNEKRECNIPSDFFGSCRNNQKGVVVNYTCGNYSEIESSTSTSTADNNTPSPDSDLSDVHKSTVSGLTMGGLLIVMIVLALFMARKRYESLRFIKRVTAKTVYEERDKANDGRDGVLSDKRKKKDPEISTSSSSDNSKKPFKRSAINGQQSNPHDRVIEVNPIYSEAAFTIEEDAERPQHSNPLYVRRLNNV